MDHRRDRSRLIHGPVGPKYSFWARSTGKASGFCVGSCVPASPLPAVPWAIFCRWCVSARVTRSPLLAVGDTASWLLAGDNAKFSPSWPLILLWLFLVYHRPWGATPNTRIGVTGFRESPASHVKMETASLASCTGWQHRVCCPHTVANHRVLGGGVQFSSPNEARSDDPLLVSQSTDSSPILCLIW